MVDCTAASERRTAEIEQWQFLGVYCGGEHLEIAPGIDVWDHPWNEVPAERTTVDGPHHQRQPPTQEQTQKQKKVWVRDTVYGETRLCPVWDITVVERRGFWRRERSRRVRFAASKLPTGIWGFFRPHPDAESGLAD